MLIIYLSLCLLVSLLVGSIIKPRNFPLGPIWLPIVGSLPRVQKLSKKLGGLHLSFLELTKEFKTNVLGLKLGNDIVVVISSYPLIREVLTNGNYDGRPDNFFVRLRCYGTRRGITCTDGPFWKAQKVFVSSHLSSLGFGKRIMEHKIREELEEVLAVIKSDGKKLYIGRVVSQAVINVLWSITAGKRISKEDLRFNKLLDLLAKRTRAFDMSGGLLGQYPWLRFIAPEKTGYNLIKSLNEEIKEFFMETINEHNETWTEDRDDDLIYAFISEMKRPGRDHAMFSIQQLLMICLDLFIAGSNATSNTIDFALLTMLLHPDIQDKVQDSLDGYYKEHRNLDYHDRDHIPYVEAVLSEIERYCNVAPLIGPRRVSEDTMLEGYLIPKNSTVLVNAYSIYVDKEIWKDPEVFRPERFLDSKGKFVYNKVLMPFGLGRRRCLGESLARHCVFIFFSEILRNYTIRPVEGLPLPTLKPLPGLTLSPQKYLARFVPRKNVP
ncbi:hypothetical protein ILUMI_04967 [Ignelater luminosus]|uniref:Uncharacterized protein n=1 Tax=Ignelater luminosus TaxID=2038154 RepID=A0A8K0D860_IGNLU|nr:hypothetical protein ILUMI_04967 [Ignelater luminosus]